jgi:hypothetical protein
MAAYGTKLPKPIRQACPQLAKADVGALGIGAFIRQPTEPV